MFPARCLSFQAVRLGRRRDPLLRLDIGPGSRVLVLKIPAGPRKSVSKSIPSSAMRVCGYESHEWENSRILKSRDQDAGSRGKVSKVLGVKEGDLIRIMAHR